MAMVLTPILKASISEKLNNSGSPSHVTFNLPDENNIVEYLRNEDIHNSTKLNSFIRRIQAADTEDSVLLKWIRDFKDNILVLENNEKLILSLLNFNWYAKDDDFVNIYQDFILNVITAYPTYIKSVLPMIIKIFYAVDVSNEEISREEERNFKIAHKFLQHIIQLVPLCEYLLCIHLDEKFPYMKQPTKVLQVYVKNLLELCSYVPKKRLTILECIIQKLIYVDVHCSRNIIEAAEYQKQDEENLLMDEDITSEHESEKNLMAYPLAYTLDVIMDTLFSYIKSVCILADGTTLDWDGTKKLHKLLLTVFDKIILPTYGSCHVQYIMFYICSLKQELSDGFLDYLWKKVQDPTIGPVFRQLAAFYIGSLLARAKYVTISTVVACLGLMCTWVHKYIDNHTAQDLNVHGTFHSVCQAIFYVFAFRNQELLEIDKGFKFLRSLNLDRIVMCRLNPLRFCDRNIVQNFANIARNFQLAYVYPVIEKNNRNLLYSNHETNAEYSAGAMIQTFFPFDPYLLKRSKHWIESNYRTYNHCHKEEDTMDCIDDDGTLTDSLFTYGTSPGFKKLYSSR